MIEISELNVMGFKDAIRGLRNPKESWEKSDSYITDNIVEIGENDFKLMKNEALAGTSNAKYRRFINVTLDIRAPLYWWKEFDTYRVGVAPNPTDIEINSCSTMHMAHKRDFEESDFSHEAFDELANWMGYIGGRQGHELLVCTIDLMNFYRRKYIETKDKKYWYAMIQIMPASYMQKRTMHINYEALYAMYKDRHAHKLNEWRELCSYLKDNCPVSELFTLEFE